MITDIDGVRVGHWTDPNAQTGCTVVLLPEGTVGSGEVRGGAPATREFGLLDPSKSVQQIDAVVLSGGSAFGLDAGSGVVRFLERQGRGFPTAGGRVPIVVGMSLYDLAVGDGSVRPTAENGYEAAAQAADEHSRPTVGLVGAGTGATTGKWRGPNYRRPGGIVSATVESGDLKVAALIAVNAVGEVDDGTSVHDLGPPAFALREGEQDGASGTNTTIGVVVTNAKLDKLGCFLCAQSGHDGLARSLFPAHSAADGDALVAVATGSVTADPFHVRLLAQNAVVMAVRSLL